MGRNAVCMGGEGDVERSEIAWGEREFRTVELSDKRLGQRLKRVAEELAARPQAPINQASADWAATKAAYRLFANPKASEQKIVAAHQQCTVQRMQGQPLVLAIQDTSYPITAITRKREGWIQLGIVEAIPRGSLCIRLWS